MGTYLVSWAFLSGLTVLLNLIGPLGSDLAESLWGINFVFSSFCAIGVKLIMRAFRWKQPSIMHLHRLSGLFG